MRRADDDRDRRHRKQSSAQVTVPAQAADLIDRLWAAGFTLIYAPVPARPRSAQQAGSVRASYLLEHTAGESLDLGRQGHVAGGGVGLAAVGEPVQEIDQCLAGGLAGLVGVDERPAVAGDGVAACPGLVDDGEVGRRDAGFVGRAGGDGCGGGGDVVPGLVTDGGLEEGRPAGAARPTAGPDAGRSRRWLFTGSGSTLQSRARSRPGVRQARGAGAEEWGAAAVAVPEDVLVLPAVVAVHAARASVMIAAVPALMVLVRAWWWPGTCRPSLAGIGFSSADVRRVNAAWCAGPRRGRRSGPFPRGCRERRAGPRVRMSANVPPIECRARAPHPWRQERPGRSGQ